MKATKITVRINLWDNYAAFMGRTKLFDDGCKDSLMARIKNKYPNAQIVDKTL